MCGRTPDLQNVISPPRSYMMVGGKLRIEVSTSAVTKLGVDKVEMIFFVDNETSV